MHQKSQLSKYKAEQLQVLKRTFSEMDKDGDGMVSVSDLKFYLESVGKFSLMEMAESWIVAKDTNCDGLVSFDDFANEFAPLVNEQVDSFLELLYLIRVQHSWLQAYNIFSDILAIFEEVSSKGCDSVFYLSVDGFPSMHNRYSKNWMVKCLLQANIACDEEDQSKLVIRHLETDEKSSVLKEKTDQIRHFISTMFVPTFSSNLGKFLSL